MSVAILNCIIGRPPAWIKYDSLGLFSELEWKLLFEDSPRAVSEMESLYKIVVRFDLVLLGLMAQAINTSLLERFGSQGADWVLQEYRKFISDASLAVE